MDHVLQIAVVQGSNVYESIYTHTHTKDIGYILYIIYTMLYNLYYTYKIFIILFSDTI